MKVHRENRGRTVDKHCTRTFHKDEITRHRMEEERVVRCIGKSLLGLLIIGEQRKNSRQTVYTNLPRDEITRHRMEEGASSVAFDHPFKGRRLKNSRKGVVAGVSPMCAPGGYSRAY